MKVLVFEFLRNYIAKSSIKICWTEKVKLKGLGILANQNSSHSEFNFNILITIFDVYCYFDPLSSASGQKCRPLSYLSFQHAEEEIDFYILINIKSTTKVDCASVIFHNEDRSELPGAYLSIYFLPPLTLSVAPLNLPTVFTR